MGAEEPSGSAHPLNGDDAHHTLTESSLPLVQHLAAEVPPCDFEVPDFSLGRSTCAVRVRGNVCYIVAGLIIKIDEATGHPMVLLIQEAKQACRGKWYIPAGRVEVGESLVHGARREVKEESGLDVLVDDLIAVEVSGLAWYRFTFHCRVVGGTLKTPAEADSESLQAQWFPVSEAIGKSFPIRSKDAQRLIKTALLYHTKVASLPAAERRPPVRVNDMMVPGMFVRFVIVQKRSDNAQLRVLLSQDTVAGTDELTVPVVEFPITSVAFFPVVISQFYREVFVGGQSALQQQPAAIVGLQCGPARRPPPHHDGLCLTLLAVVRHGHQPVLTHAGRYVWKDIEDDETRVYLEHMMTNGPAFVLI